MPAEAVHERTTDDDAMVGVLGAISYGEWRAHEGAKARADAAGDEAERRVWRTVAAQELRHFKGFTARLEAMGVDPDEAMAPFQPAFAAYDDRPVADEIEAAVFGFLGEGIADDLMAWLGTVVDAELAAFVATVMADEAEHEGHAAAHVRAVIGEDPARIRAAAAASQAMIDNMIASGGGVEAAASTPMLAFLRIGRPDELLRTITRGFARRVREIGVDPSSLRSPFAAG